MSRVRHAGLVVLAATVFASAYAAGASESVLFAAFELEDAAEILPGATAVPMEYAQGRGALVLGSASDIVFSDINKRATILGEATVFFDVPREIQLVAWLRVQWHCYCGRGVKVSTTGTSLGDAAPGGIYTDTNRPGVWCWVRLGVFRYSAGKQSFSFTQSGHAAALDALVLSESPTYVPAGHDAQERTIVLEKLPESTVTRPDGMLDAAIDEGVWSDFQLDFAHKMPEAQGMSAVEFCRKDDGSCYRLSLETLPEGPSRAALCRVTKEGAAISLAEISLPAEKQAWHAYRLVRRGEGIEVQRDGFPLLACTDRVLSEGSLHFVSNASDFTHCEDVELCGIRNYRDLLSPTVSGWNVAGGAWRNAALDTEEQAPCWGRAEEAGLLVAPWKMGDSFFFSTDVHLSTTGLAGLAFGVNKSAYSVLGVYRAASGVEEKLEARWVDVRDGVSTVRMTVPVASPKGEQWRRLRIAVSPRDTALDIDGERAIHVKSPASASAGGIGLAVQKGTACFLNAEAWQARDLRDGDFLFEPECERRNASYWQVRSGAIEFQRHPAYLLLKGDAGKDAVIEYKRSIPRNVGVELTLREAGGDIAAVLGSQAGQDILPSAPEVVLPSDPRVCIRLTAQTDPPVVYELSSDLIALEAPVLCRNGIEVARAEKLKKPRERRDRALYFEICGNTVSGANHEGEAVHFSFPELLKDVPLTLSIAGTNLDSNVGAVYISRICVKPIFSLLPEAPGALDSKGKKE